MSTSRSQPSDQEQKLDQFTPTLAPRSSEELSSGSLTDPKAVHGPAHQRDIAYSKSRHSLSSSTSALLTPSELRPQSHESLSYNGRNHPVCIRDDGQEARTIILRSFAPRVVVYASTDAEEFARNKGFKDGLTSLLRPYGERLQGKVVIRDSVGGSKAWEDFGMRFVDSRRIYNFNPDQSRNESSENANGSSKDDLNSFKDNETLESQDLEGAIDQVLHHYSQHRDMNTSCSAMEYSGIDRKSHEGRLSTVYARYLRKLLSTTTIAPYETFSHPVACIIAVSSHHPAPIEALRELYVDTGRGNCQIPPWVGTEYLRYYVLIHDEGKDHITKSTALFDLMKRHFGLHCHLLRLRGSQCIQTDDDSRVVPHIKWPSAEEEMDQSRVRGEHVFVNGVEGD